MRKKICRKCRKEYPIHFFSKHPHGKDGYLNNCKFCLNLADRERYKLNPRKYLDANEKWRKKNPEKHNRCSRNWSAKNRDRSNAIKRNWRLRNPEKSAQATRNWQKNNPEKVNAHGRRWRKENHEKWSLINRRNQYRRKQAEGYFTNDDWQNILKIHNNSCVFCGTKDNITIDHIIPLSRGGTNWPENLEPLCFTCNTRKHNKM